MTPWFGHPDHINSSVHVRARKRASERNSSHTEIFVPRVLDNEKNTRTRDARSDLERTELTTPWMFARWDF